MAKYEAYVAGGIDEVFEYINDAIVKGSSTISIEESSLVQVGETKIAIRAYERYSVLGQNRVSLHLTIASNEEETHVSIISTGASQGMLFKYNFFSEDRFLQTVIPAIERIKK